MSFAPSDPSKIQFPTQEMRDRQLIRTDIDDVAPELREEFLAQQQEAHERLHGTVPEWRRRQHIDTSNLPRRMTAEEREAGRAFMDRLKGMSKLNPAPGLHLTFPEFFGAVEDDPDGFEAWSRTQRQLTLRPDPNDLTE